MVNNFEIYSLPVLTGAAKYPDEVVEKLQKEVLNFKVFNAGKIAEDLGNIKAQNIVLLGALVKAMGLEDIDWESVLKELIPPKLLDLNIKAFKAGLEQYLHIIKEPSKRDRLFYCFAFVMLPGKR